MNKKIQDFPSDMAYPLGGPDADSKYFVLQMHYDNPNKTKATDKSGLRLYVTQNIRPSTIEFGILTVGAVPSVNSFFFQIIFFTYT